MKNASKVVFAFLAGAVAGTTIGLLLAPDKGEVTRKKIKSSFNDLSEKASEQYQKYKKAISKEDKNTES